MKNEMIFFIECTKDSFNFEVQKTNN